MRRMRVDNWRRWRGCIKMIIDLTDSFLLIKVDENWLLLIKRMIKVSLLMILNKKNAFELS